MFSNDSAQYKINAFMLLTTHRSNSTFLFKFAGGSTLSLENLPATGNITENSPANALVYVFSVKLSPSCAEVAEGYPIIINSNPLTDAFQIVPESKLVYRVSFQTMYSNV